MNKRQSRAYVKIDNTKKINKTFGCPFSIKTPMFKFKTDIKSIGVHRATNSYNLKLKLKQNARLSVERLLLHKVFFE